jgi:hypothetical protein
MGSKYFIDADNEESRVPCQKLQRTARIISKPRSRCLFWSWPCLARRFGSWSTLEYMTERNAREAHAMLSSAGIYKNNATECEQEALRATTPVLKSKYQGVAQQWREMAEQAKRSAVNGPKRSGSRAKASRAVLKRCPRNRACTLRGKQEVAHAVPFQL